MKLVIVEAGFNFTRRPGGTNVRPRKRPVYAGGAPTQNDARQIRYRNDCCRRLADYHRRWHSHIEISVADATDSQSYNQSQHDENARSDRDP